MSRQLFRAKIICAVGITSAVLSLGWPAAAQFFPFEERFTEAPRRQPQVRKYRQRVPQPQPEQTNAPAPKHSAAVPSIRILVLGDTMADWLAYGLEEALSETPEIGIVRKHKHYSGLIRYEQRTEIEWSKVARDLVAAEKPQAIVMLVGLHDRQAMRERAPVADRNPATLKPGIELPSAVGPEIKAQPPNNDQTLAVAEPEPQRARPRAPAEFRTERWEELYTTRIDETIAALKTGNVPVLWVSVPAVRDAKSTRDLQYLNDLVKARVEKAGLIFVNAWDGFVDERNNFLQRGPDETGQTRPLRTNDGIHFTKFGARKLAHYVERDLRRVLREPILSTATTPAKPAPAQTAKPSGPSSRPLTGPVVPLGAGLNEPDDLLGGASPQSDAAPPPVLDPVANRLLLKGASTPTEAGRADDFAWPPRMPNLVIKEQLPPAGVPLTIVRTPPRAAVPHAALPAAAPRMPVPPRVRVARQPMPHGQVRQQTQPPKFWRPQTDNFGPPIFFGLFGAR